MEGHVSMKKIRIISLMVMIIISVSLLVTSTYAWFTKNQKVDSTNIEVKVRTVEKMYISTDAVKWSNAITLQDILKASYETKRLNQIPTNFQAYSSIGELDNGKINMFYGLVRIDKNKENETYGKKVLTANQIKEIDGIKGGYLAFDLYFKNASSTNIYLGRKSYANYVGEDVGIQNTLRIAFVLEGTLPLNASIKDIQELKTSNNSNVIIWEPNSDKHTENAILEAKRTYNMDITDNQEALTYYGIKSEIIDPVSITSQNELYFQSMKSNITTSALFHNGDEANKFLFNMPEGITKLRIYAWVEGQDVDCENAAAGSDFAFNLNFSTQSRES